MTPKEKAEELKEKCDGYACYAEVTVDEIINSVEEEHVSDLFIEYWNEVKQEIEQL